MKPLRASVTVSNGRAEVFRFLDVLPAAAMQAQLAAAMVRPMGLRSPLIAAAGFVAKAQVSSTAINEALEES
jgi:hypothetical protein